MTLKLCTTGLAFIVMALVQISETIPQAIAQQRVKFICGTSFDASRNQRFPATLAWTPARKQPIIVWTKPVANYTPQQRCEEVSPRFQEAYQTGTLQFITNGFMRGQQVICAAKGYRQPCSTLLMTLRPGENSLEALNELRDILNGRQVGPAQHSSGTPQMYYEINIDEVLKNAPVENE
ncbi:COP23 domain-containing protein [Gloeothece verrucosa]|uniref:Circadian oscillating protein COP23 n=1 Tax=Gloeothece verrucosa (strain PCC 7822) TaxID=497965 RepID=E0U739_GLOV7|nr:COP23 domain-containing protein [Gloeothece verrucosa]ADN17195.1 hypothetical protein Cyan7822_5314 [Gloeothece verrucosa PCC 7822]